MHIRLKTPLGYWKVYKGLTSDDMNKKTLLTFLTAILY